MNPTLDWRGVIVPLTTPFADDESVDFEAFSQQIEWMLAQGVHGVVVGGSTGEGFALDEDEILALTRRALEMVGRRVPVMTSIMADSTRATVRRATLLAELPISGLQVAPPHYIFSPDDDGLLDFYRQIGTATSLPIVIYNVISWAKVSPVTAARIMDEVSSVRAVKQSDKDLGNFADLVLAVGPERVFGAIDGSLMSCYDLGVAGSIAAIASAAPGPSVQLWDAVTSGRRQDALALNQKLGLLWQQLAASNLPARVKAAQTQQGLSAGIARSPMAKVCSGVREAIVEALRNLR